MTPMTDAEFLRAVSGRLIMFPQERLLLIAARLERIDTITTSAGGPPEILPVKFRTPTKKARKR